MSDIIPFDATPSGKAEVPAHIAAVFTDSNIPSRATIDQLSYRGKVWRRIVAGEETQLTKLDPDSGEHIPIPVVGLVVLDLNKSRSRAYYEGGYVEGQNTKPACYSRDGVKPDESVAEPQCSTCAACPQAVKGSKITPDGKQVTACAQFKRIAVVPAAAKVPKMMEEHPVMLLRIAQTSMWDKENGENEKNGWYAWDQYTDMLRARGVMHTGAVETRVKFDTRVAYPKLLFSASRWLSATETAVVKQRLEKDAEQIAKILDGGDADGVMGQPSTAKATPAATGADDTAAAAAQAAADAAKKEAEKKAKAEAAKAKKEAEAKAKAEAEAKAKAEAAAAAGGDDGDAWGGDEAPAAAPAPAPAPVAASKAAVETGTPPGLSDLLNNWDD